MGWFRKRSKDAAPVEEVPAVPVRDGVEIPPHDPLHAYLVQAGGPVDLEKLDLESAALDALRESGSVLVVPLISQGELLGTLSLGPRLSDQPYSADDRRLLSGLASQVAPAVKVANLVKQQESQVKERERIEQELRVAALIQQTLLPKELPSPPGWQIDAYYRPARAVGGDFYDFISLSDGRLGFVVGDVTDKGVPAALVMATTRSHLRAAALRSSDPGEVLADANSVLVDEIPPGMFVTCLYGVLDVESGDVRFANAGHNLPYVKGESGVKELRATGMPLGLMPGMEYDVVTARLLTGEIMLLSSDGIVEAHGPDGEMFGFDAVQATFDSAPDTDVIGHLLEGFDRYVGADAEQEDDVTLVTLRRAAGAEEAAAVFASVPTAVLADFSVPSEQGNEREVMNRVAVSVEEFGFGEARLERLKTAVSEAAMNAIEHGNGGDPDLDVGVRVEARGDRLVVRITDWGGDAEIPDAEEPDIEAKLAGEQRPRGWGLFLIERMVDEMRTSTDDGRHTVELVMNREET
ncbi:MAG TPA: SpoIIE family protein phosphatase [Acidimicrobiia bacterium]|nr:SpoIIE family protein phosphatase [Acidimicrobiia bacterium]